MARKKRVSKKRIRTDDQGPFIWERYFVGGKQKRRKVRLIDGERIDDPDEYLLRNADDIYLHQAGRWDLLEQRRLEAENQ
jgi:hypothetical protein